MLHFDIIPSLKMPVSESLPIKRERGPLILSAATNTTARNWRDPDDKSRELTRDLQELVNFAQIAERGKFHNLFFVDHLSWFDVYGNSHEVPARNGVNASRIDPLTVVSALASHTKSIGFVTTISTVSEHPYHLARRLATADHLTGGRVGWNIVASCKNLLAGEPLPEHDERYVKTEEYLDAIYKLLLSSWRDDALVYDKKKGVFADPEAIREINHIGKYFNIKGPSITEPTKQRFPLIVQAGTSKKGIEFAAENAELVFIGLESAEKIPEIRSIAKERFGRDPYSIKFISILNPFLGRTHEEAVAKFEKAKSLENLETNLAYFGGVSGFDLSKYDWDDVVDLQEETNGIKSTVENVLKKGRKVQTKRDIAEKWGSQAKYVGTASEVADQIEEILKKYDIDGFNFSINSYPGTILDLADILVPELQRRGLAQTEYATPGGTLRENFYGKQGQTFLPDDHPAYNLRWKAGVTKEQFEEKLRNIEAIRDARRASLK